MLHKDSDGRIYTTVKSDEQIELCNYVIVNGRRFDYDGRRDYRHPGTGHDGFCQCFLCNH